MRHLEEATILALRDGEPVDQAARAHLDGCSVCSAALAAARHRAEHIERTLSALDRPVEATAARAGVRARLRQQTQPTRHMSRWGGWHVGRAATLLLLTAGAAAALPGSPLRSLWSPRPETEPTDKTPAAEAAVSGSSPAATGVSESGIAVAVREGVVQVVVRGAQPGVEILVTWTAGPSARVTAPAGSRFTYAAGRIEVDASRGTIRIELPSDAERVSLEVDGRPYLAGSPADLELRGPIVGRTDDTIRFRVDEG